jgi:hypothetical protein
MGDLRASVVHRVDKQELLASESKELGEQLLVTHLRGNLPFLLPGEGYQLTRSWRSTSDPAASKRGLTSGYHSRLEVAIIEASR